MASIYEYKSASIDATIKDADVKKGIVTGYFAHFDSVDGDGDVIRKGAFTKTLQEAGPASSRPRIKHLLNHDTNKTLGKILHLEEDPTGLYYESQIGTHALGSDFVKMIESGLITEHSIGFKTVNKKSAKGIPGAKWELTEIKLWEGSSLTAWGANPNTPYTGLKSYEKASKAAQRFELLSKAMRDGSFTDETYELLEIEIKQLQQLFIELSKATEPEEPSTLPDEEKNKQLVEAMKQFRLTI